MSVGQHQKERRLHTEPAAIEDLPDAGRGQYAVFAQMVGQDTTERNHYGHQQMRQSADVAGLQKKKSEISLYRLQLKFFSIRNIPSAKLFTTRRIRSVA